MMQARNWTPSDLNRREPRLRHCFLTHALKGRSGRMRKPGVMVLAQAFDGDANEVLKAYFLDQLGSDAKLVDINVEVRFTRAKPSANGASPTRRGSDSRL